MSGLQVNTLNGVKVYNCTAGKSTPEWFQEFKHREGTLRYNEGKCHVFDPMSVRSSVTH